MLKIDVKAIRVILMTNRDANKRPRDVHELAQGMKTRKLPSSTSSYLYSVFRGERDVRLSFVGRMAASLKVSVFDILDEE